MPEFYAPNSKAEVLSRWRRDERLLALGAIAHRGGTISGKELAAVLGVSPRALRKLLVESGVYFMVEYRAYPGKKDEAWYRMRPESAEKPKELPPIRREALPDGGKAPRIRYSGGPTPAVERFAAVPRITTGEK